MNINSAQRETNKEIDITSLIHESSKIIGQLHWDTTQAREFIKDKMNVTSRQQLNSDQLITFIDFLKAQLNQRDKPSNK